jgi:hypothetical protein
MKAQHKIDIETYLIANQTTYPMYFEGQTVNTSDNHMTVKFVPIDVMRPAFNCEVHEVIVRFYCYSKKILTCDVMIDALSDLLSEKRIEESSYILEMDTMTTFQRGNKFDDTWENIADIKFRHFHNPSITP